MQCGFKSFFCFTDKSFNLLERPELYAEIDTERFAYIFEGVIEIEGHIFVVRYVSATSAGKAV